MLPDPFPVFHHLLLILDEALQKVAQDQTAHAHEDSQKKHGPAQRGKATLAGFHQHSQAAEEAEAAQHANRAEGLPEQSKAKESKQLPEWLAHASALEASRMVVMNFKVTFSESF